MTRTQTIAVTALGAAALAGAVLLWDQWGAQAFLAGALAFCL